MRTLVWLRRDLRTEDHAAFSAACAQGEEGTLALYVITPEQWREHEEAAVKIHFWLENLRLLSAHLAARSIPLLIRTVDRFDDVPRLLRGLTREHEISAVFAHREYEVNEAERDAGVEEALRDEGVSFDLLEGRCIAAPGSVLTQQGTPYTVFTPFRKRWEQALASDPPHPIAEVAGRGTAPCAPDPIPDTVPGFDLGSVRPDLWPAGEGEARRRLERFLDQKAAGYSEARDLPAVPGTSLLSPYLAAGVISPRTCLDEARRCSDRTAQSGLSTWIGELAWRDFYTHVLAAFPRVSRGRAFQTDADVYVEWRDAPEELSAWKEGRTGVPIVDAAQRQLLRTGWMHNRLRMVSAMYLSKTLLLDWREGERHFMQHLVDGDLAANNGGWQWSASTGTDAAPYFRVFNPIRQGEKFDPDGSFVHRFLPELESVSGKDLHDPRRLGALERSALGYPDMLVDPKYGRQRAIEAFRRP